MSRRSKPGADHLRAVVTPRDARARTRRSTDTRRHQSSPPDSLRPGSGRRGRVAESVSIESRCCPAPRCLCRRSDRGRRAGQFGPAPLCGRPIHGATHVLTHTGWVTRDAENPSLTRSTALPPSPTAEHRTAPGPPARRTRPRFQADRAPRPQPTRLNPVRRVESLPVSQ